MLPTQQYAIHSFYKVRGKLNVNCNYDICSYTSWPKANTFPGRTFVILSNKILKINLVPRYTQDGLKKLQRTNLVFVKKPKEMYKMYKNPFKETKHKLD